MTYHSMFNTPGTPWQAHNWRDQSAGASNTPSPPMLSLNGSFLPLVPISNPFSTVPVYAVDQAKCGDIQFTIGKVETAPFGMEQRSNSARRLEIPTKIYMAPDANVKGRQYAAIQNRFNTLMGDVPQLGRSESRPLSMTSPEAFTAAGPEALPRIDYRPTTDSYRSTTDSYRPIPDPYRTSVDMHRPFPSSIDPDSKKIYCTYWLRNGECDYMQQGCRYKHEMPDMETLKSIGFLTIPRWYREKLQYDRGADRPRQDEASLRKVLERSGLVGRDSKVVRSDESEDEEVVCPVPAPRLRVVGPETQISAASSPREKENKETILQRPLTPETRRSSDTSSDATFNNGDLLGDFEDSSDETSSPTVPRNTPEPEQRPFREGRFVPSNERVKPAPVDVSVRTPSPLVLEHTVPKPQSPDVKTVKSKMRDMHINTPVSTTPKPVAAVKAGLTHSRYATPTRVPVLPRQVSKNEKPVRQSDRVRTSRANERPRRTTRGVVLEEVKKREKEQKRKVEKEEEVVMGYKPMFKNHKF